jgi:hypothetical protein
MMKMHTPACGRRRKKRGRKSSAGKGLAEENYFLFSSLFFYKKGMNGDEMNQKEEPLGYTRAWYFSPGSCFMKSD